MSKITPFNVGEVLADGVTEIMSRSGFFYHVRFVCCGREEDVKHHTIRDRVSPHRLKERVHIGVCGRCARGHEMFSRRIRKELPPSKVVQIEAKKDGIMPYNAWPRPQGLPVLPIWGMQSY